MNMKALITVPGDFDKAIDGVRKSAKLLDDTIQHIALSAIAHNKEHHDPVYVNRLYLALGKGHRKAALVSWFLQFGSLVANSGEDKKTRPFADTKDKDTDMVGAALKPWFDFKPDPPADQVLDVRKLVLALLKKASDKGVKEDQVGFLAELRELVSEDIDANG